MKRKAVSILCIIFILLLVSSCGSKEVTQKEARTVEFCYPDGITALTGAKLIKEKPKLDDSIDIQYEMQKTPDLLATKVLKEEADIAIVPSNLAAQVFNKGLPYRIVGTSTWGSMYLISTEDIEDIEDLKGKEIYAFGKGLTPDLVLRYVLDGNGIDPDEDIEITYLNSGSEIGPAFLGGKTNLALVSEPLASTIMMKNKNAKLIVDLNKQWSDITGAAKGYPQSSLIVKSALIDEDLEFVEQFIDAYEESRAWAEEYPEELSEYADALGIGVNKEVILKGIIWTNVETFHIADCRDEYKAYYEAILDFAPDFIGGKLPGEELYFGK